MIKTPTRKLPLEEGAGTVTLLKRLYGPINDATFEYLLQFKWYTDKDGNPIVYLDTPKRTWYTYAGLLLGAVGDHKQAWDDNTEKITLYGEYDGKFYPYTSVTKADFERYARRRER